MAGHEDDGHREVMAPERVEHVEAGHESHLIVQEEQVEGTGHRDFQRR
jgi:hypothetical protein